MRGHHIVQSTLASSPTKDGRNEAAQLVALRSFFASIDTMRVALNLDVEEMLLYLGVGYLNTERIQQIGSNGYITSTNVSSVADFMKIPKETARRKIKRLIALGLIENKRGVVVSDVARWFAFVRQMPLCTHQTAEADRR
jgi:Fic family protein